MMNIKSLLASKNLSFEEAQNVAEVGLECTKWVANDFSKYKTYKKGIKNLKDDVGDSVNIRQSLGNLFWAKAMAQQAQFISMGNLLNDKKSPTVTVSAVFKELSDSVEKFGVEGVVESSTTYKCYEDWAYIYQFYKSITGQSEEVFGKLVTFLYDGYSK